MVVVAAGVPVGDVPAYRLTVAPGTGWLLVALRTVPLIVPPDRTVYVTWMFAGGMRVRDELTLTVAV